MNIVDELVKVALLGATWVLYLLFALSFAAIAAMLERWWFYRRNAVGSERLDVSLRRAILRDDEDGVEVALRDNPCVQAAVLRDAMQFVRGGPEAFSEAVDGAMASERKRLDRGTTLLGTIGNNAPFVGLFGTVLGVIEAFSYLGVGGEAAMGNVMSGIAEALVATAVGIFVAIPAVVAFNVAQKKSGEIETHVLALAKRTSAWLRVRNSAEQVDEALGRYETRQADATPLEAARRGA